MTSAVAPAMILAAGRGERMRPLTDTTPKPLLQVRGKPLMQWPMEALARGGFTDVVVNTAWLGEQISGTFGNQFGPWPSSIERDQLLNSEQPNVTAITYSHEGLDFGGALETAGGIVRALPALGDVFWVLAGDVFAPDFVFAQTAVARFKASDKLAHIWLVPNPGHNPKGDFGLTPDGLALNSAETRFTYSTIGLYRSALFALPYCSISPGNPHGSKAPLAPLLRAAMDRGLVSAELYEGAWTDVGTPERLTALNAHHSKRPSLDF
jgi:MurNAc alpha-1-phosphate uridylyltransferase